MKTPPPTVRLNSPGRFQRFKVRSVFFFSSSTSNVGQAACSASADHVHIFRAAL